MQTRDNVDIVEAYEREGFVVVPQVLSQDLAQELCESVLQDACRLIFAHEENPPKPGNPGTIELFFDHALRKKRLQNPRCVWQDGDTRKPLIAKRTGMLNVCFNPDVREHVLFNPAVVSPVARLYGTQRLGYIHGPDRICIKGKGAEDMPRHLDHHLFYDYSYKRGYDGRFPRRVQAFVCGRVPQDVPLRDSGTLEVIPYFHHYFALARVFFHPQDGLFPLPDNKSPFHILEGNFEAGLEAFNAFIRAYTPVYAALCDGLEPEEIDADEDVILFALTYRIPVPTEQIYQLAPTPVACQPGDLVCFDQRLPHRSLRNLSRQARIVFYVRLFEIPPGWYGSQEHRTLLENNARCLNTTSAQHNNAVERERLMRYEPAIPEDPTRRQLHDLLQTIAPYE